MVMGRSTKTSFCRYRSELTVTRCVSHWPEWQGMKRLQCSLSGAELGELFGNLDADGNGTLDLKEFADVLDMASSHRTVSLLPLLARKASALAPFVQADSDHNPESKQAEIPTASKGASSQSMTPESKLQLAQSELPTNKLPPLEHESPDLASSSQQAWSLADSTPLPSDACHVEPPLKRDSPFDYNRGESVLDLKRGESDIDMGIRLHRQVQFKAAHLIAKAVFTDLRVFFNAWKCVGPSQSEILEQRGSVVQMREWLLDNIVETEWFDILSVVLVLASCVLLALQAPTIEDDSDLDRVYSILDLTFTSLFTIEMLLKVAALTVRWHAQTRCHAYHLRYAGTYIRAGIASIASRCYWPYLLYHSLPNLR